MSLEATYRISTSLELSRLKALASEERNWREDHSWALREDPTEFAEMMHQQSEHQFELLSDTLGEEHSALREPGRPLFWDHVIIDIVSEAYFRLAILDGMLRQINKVASPDDRHKGSLKPEKELPTDLLRSFQALRFLLGAAKNDLIECIKRHLLPSPPLRQFCEREPQGPRSTMIWNFIRKPQREHPAHRLIPMLYILFDERRLDLLSLYTWTDAIGHLIKSDSAVAALVSQRIASLLSSLSVVSECLRQLHLFQPWAWKIEQGMILNKGKLQKCYNKTSQVWGPILNINIEGSQLYKYADPTDGKFNCPTNRHCTKQNIEMLRRSEANLDAFWEALDQFLKSKTVRSQPGVFAHLLGSDRTIQRTPAWGEPGKKAISSEASTQYHYKPFSSVYHEASKQTTGHSDCTALSESSTKLKTRGRTAQASETETPPPIPHETTQHLKSFAVDRRAYKVFKALL